MRQFLAITDMPGEQRLASNNFNVYSLTREGSDRYLCYIISKAVTVHAILLLLQNTVNKTNAV